MQSGLDGSQSGPSRTPSPLPPDHSPHGSALGHGTHANHAHSPHPLPPIPNSALASQQGLIPPATARPKPHGARRQMPRSRSPSPDRRSVELSQIQNRMRSFELDVVNRNLLDGTDTEDEQPIAMKPSAKALGKRRMVENFDA